MSRPLRYGRIDYFTDKKNAIDKKDGLGFRVEESLDFKKYKGECCKVREEEHGKLVIECFGLSLEVPKGHWKIVLKEIK